ncbi:MAG: hypothetical protein VXZ63_11615 [Planctomycetota bacterium]|nr:hypothetical protein [Planctomycetota bacterium]
MTRWLSLLLPALYVLPGLGCASYYYGGDTAYSHQSLPYLGHYDCEGVGCTDHQAVPSNPLQHVAHVSRSLSLGYAGSYFGMPQGYPYDCDTCNYAGGRPLGFLAGASNLWGHRDYEAGYGCDSCMAGQALIEHEAEEVGSVDVQEGESIMVPMPTPSIAPEDEDAPGPLPGPETSAFNSPKNSPRSVAENRTEWRNNSQKKVR